MFTSNSADADHEGGPHLPAAYGQAERLPLRIPDLHDLNLLVAVAACGSIGQAAIELGTTQPSASRRLAALERSLRIKLVQRGARGSTLTPSGQVVVDWAAALLRATAQFTSSVETLGQQQDGLVNAAVSMTIAEHYAPQWLAAVRTKSPETVVNLTMANSQEVMGLVEGGRVDLGLVESPHILPSLESFELGRDELVTAVLPDHPWAKAIAISAAELGAGGLLVRERGAGSRDTLDLALSKAGVELLAGLELASNTSLKSAALAGMGPVVLPRVALRAELACGALAEVSVEHLDLSCRLSLVWADPAHLAREAAELLIRAAQDDRRFRARRLSIAHPHGRTAQRPAVARSA